MCKENLLYHLNWHHYFLSPSVCTLYHSVLHSPAVAVPPAADAGAAARPLPVATAVSLPSPPPPPPSLHLARKRERERESDGAEEIFNVACNCRVKINVSISAGMGRGKSARLRDVCFRSRGRRVLKHLEMSSNSPRFSAIGVCSRVLKNL